METTEGLWCVRVVVPFARLLRNSGVHLRRLKRLSEQFVDQVFKWLHLRHCGQRAPILFYTETIKTAHALRAKLLSVVHRTLTSVKDNFWTVFATCPDTFSSFYSTPSQTTLGSLLLIGIRRTTCATPPGGSLAIWLNNLFTQKQARTSYWERWAANHEYEELKEGIWLEPTLGHAAKRIQGSVDRQAPQ